MVDMVPQCPECRSVEPYHTPMCSKPAASVTSATNGEEMAKVATLRDKFAMAALQGLLAGEFLLAGNFLPDFEEAAYLAYETADAMLLARK